MLITILTFPVLCNDLTNLRKCEASLVRCHASIPESESADPMFQHRSVPDEPYQALSRHSRFAVMSIASPVIAKYGVSTPTLEDRRVAYVRAADLTARH